MHHDENEPGWAGLLGLGLMMAMAIFGVVMLVEGAMR